MLATLDEVFEEFKDALVHNLSEHQDFWQEYLEPFLTVPHDDGHTYAESSPESYLHLSKFTYCGCCYNSTLQGYERMSKHPGTLSGQHSKITHEVWSKWSFFIFSNT